MPGAWCARSRAWSAVNTHVSLHGHTGNTRHSPRDGFNGFLRALPGDRRAIGLFATSLADIDVSGPLGLTFATRLRRPRAGALVRSIARVHRIPPYVRDGHETPLCEGAGWPGL